MLRHILPVAPNLLNRQFMVAKAYRTRVVDIIAIWTLEGWLYLASVLTSTIGSYWAER